MIVVGRDPGAMPSCGIFLVDGFVPTLLLALVAGIGNGLFTPAALASLPERRGPGAPAGRHIALRGRHRLRLHRGPGLAALILLVAAPRRSWPRTP